MSYNTKQLTVYGVIGVLVALPIIATMMTVPWAETATEPKPEPAVCYSPGLPPSEWRVWPLNMLNLTVSNFSEPLGVGSQAFVVVSIKSPYDAPNATVRLDLMQVSDNQPVGVSFVDANSSVWKVDLEADVLISFEAKIKAVEVGYAQVLVTATWYDDSEGHIKHSDSIWISVFENDIQISHYLNVLLDFNIIANPLVPPISPSIIIANETIPLTIRYGSYERYQEIVSGRWMELIVSVNACAWIALVISCVTLYFHNKMLILEKRKLGALILSTIIGGVALTFASGLHQIKPVIMDAQEIYYGFPFVWLKAFRGTWMTVTPWHYNVQWLGLVGDLALYLWVVFIAYSMISFLNRKIAHLHLEMKE